MLPRLLKRRASWGSAGMQGFGGSGAKQGLQGFLGAERLGFFSLRVPFLQVQHDRSCSEKGFELSTTDQRPENKVSV